MTPDQLRQKIEAVETLFSVYYDKFETSDNVAAELRDLFDDWESDGEISEPDVEDFAPNQIDDYHFECLAYSEAQERLQGYPERAEEILARMPPVEDTKEGQGDG